MIQETKHISFDLWLTLIRSGKDFKTEKAKLFCSFFDLPVEADQVVKVFRETDLLVNRINETVGKNVDAFEMYMLCLHRLGVDMQGLRLESLEEFYQLTEQLFFRHPPELLNPEILPLLAALKARGYTTNITSNTGYIKGRLLRKLMEANGVAQYMDFQIYSDEVGASKPSPRIFEHMYRQAKELQAGNLSKQQIIHIGDNRLTDVEGAKAFGIHALLINEQSITLKNIEDELSIFVA
ncbi:HAD family hydrolase [Pseudoflavitalea sp. X16]|uniref:HAD family hydrolase n=1 Tax=Paraflavitalea devenefica TaxID=2716334 RepID=UPI0014244AA2|nr:HAD family hydrolase [Paraflavitalea devenefica]NII29664.1 HAD family hydrolase [Paraflavitalea devenefica]